MRLQIVRAVSIGAGKINNASSGHDPGVVVMGVNSLSRPYGFYYNEKAANKNYYTFESGRYRFPVSGTPYTALTEEPAAAFGLKIEILSAAGDEMQIKVTGAAVIAPTVHFVVGDKTTSSLTASARIAELNGSNVTACGFILSTKSDYKTDPNAKTVYLKPNEYGKFSYAFDGLEENTKYFCTVFTEGSGGRHEKLNYGYTASTPVPRDYYIAHLYMGKSEAERSYDVRLKPGDTIPDAVTKSMKKNGYLFAGWYLDETYTERFDLNSTQTEIADFTLFAKWIETSSAAVLTIHDATPRYGMTFASEVGSTFAVPDIQPRAGYTFEGWYTDAALTIPYDFGMVIEDNDGLDLYAKWTKDEPEPPVETTGPADTTVPPETTKPNEATTGNETEPAASAGGNAVVIIVIAVAAVIAAGAVIYILLRKRQKN